MSAEIIDLAAAKPLAHPDPASAETPPTADPPPLFLAAKTALRLLERAQGGLRSRTRAERKASELVLKVVDQLKTALADHQLEASYSLGQTFFVAMGADAQIARSLGGIRRALAALALSLPDQR